MFLPNSFIDALADYESARYVIFGVPFDNTSSYRAGSRWAPDAMRQASANFESYNPTFDIDLVDLPIYDAGIWKLQLWLTRPCRVFTKLQKTS